MRLVIVGRESFIAQHVMRAAASEAFETIALPFDADVTDVVRAGDVLFNFALNPAYKSQAYDEAFDCDLKVARIAAKAGARTVMVSSRKVYPEQSRWNAREDSPADGDGSAYGINKAQTEARIQAIPGARVAIFRLSNICGYEYQAGAPRPTFFGIMQHSLKTTNTIRFDMHPATRRDFLPIEHCSRSLVMALKADVEGVYNLGSGYAVSCGELADWIMKGFQGGTLIVDPPVVRDEFFLNMDKWKKQFHVTPIDLDTLHAYCREIGHKLRCDAS